MVKKIRMEWNDRGFRALLKGKPLQVLTLETAEGVASRAGDGFVASQLWGSDRVSAVVRTDSFEAKRRQAEDNTLMNVLGGKR